MDKEKLDKEKAAYFRKKAEQKLQSMKKDSDAISENMSSETQQLIQELEIHQIELEMQNEELRKAQIKIEKTSQKYFDLYNLASIGYLTLDEKGTIIELNLTAASLLGENRSNLINKNFNNYIKREDKDIFYLHLKKIPELEKSSCELRLKKKDGTEFYGYLECLSVQNKIEESLKFKIALLDITKRMQVLNTLKLSEKKYKQLFDSMTEMFQVIEIIYDENGNAIDYYYRKVNPAFEKLVGMKKRDLVGKRAKKIFGIVEDYWIKTFERVDKTGISENFEKYGEELDKFYSAYAWKIGDKQVAIIFSDITEQKRAKDDLIRHQYYLMKAQEIGNIGTWEFDLKKNELFWTEQNYRNFGVPVGTPLTYEIFLNCVHPDDRDFVNTQWQNALKGKPYYIEHRLLVNAEIRWVREKADIDFDKNGVAIKVIGVTQNITKSKNTELALRESEEKFRTLVIGNEEIIYSIDTNGIFLLSEGKGLEKLGLKPGQVVGKSVFDIYKDYPDMLNQMRKTFKGEILKFEVQIGDNYFRNWYTPQINHENKIIGLLGMSVNITERKLTENNLLQSEARFRELVETINSGVAMYEVINDGMSGDDYIIKSFNRKALKIEGLTKADVVGKSLKDLRPNIDEYGLIPIFRNVWISGKSEFFPAKEYVDKKYNSYYENRVYKLPTGEIVSVYDDVTKRENAILEIIESRKRFDLAISATKDGIYDWNLITNEIYYSPAWKNMLGYEDNELSNDFSVWMKLTGDEDVKKVMEMNSELFNKEIDRFELEFKMKHKNGHWLDILSRGDAVFDETGKAVRMVGTHTDITERKKTDEQIKQDLKEKNTLLQELYHRTKNNMQVIVSMLKMQSRRSDNEYVNTSFMDIVTKINAMSLVHQKLYQAKNLSKINLKGYIIDLTQLLRQSYSLQARNISLNFEMEDVMVLIDSAVPLGLVLNELISNVFKHAFPNREKGEIFIKIYKEENETINIILADNGIGIPADLNLRKINSMGLDIMFSLFNNQLKGEATYTIDNGLKWHLKFRDDLHKERV